MIKDDNIVIFYESY